VKAKVSLGITMWLRWARMAKVWLCLLLSGLSMSILGLRWLECARVRPNVAGVCER
jgi:hypothetical protein